MTLMLFLMKQIFIKVTMCLAYTPVWWQTFFFSWQPVWSKFSMLLGRTATWVWVIWLYIQNINIFTHTHMLLWLCAQEGWCCCHCPLRASPVLLPREDTAGAGAALVLGVLPHCGVGNSSSSNINWGKPGATILKYLSCVVLTQLGLIIPPSSQMLCIKTGIDFSIIRNVIFRVDCNSNIVINVP